MDYILIWIKLVVHRKLRCIYFSYGFPNEQVLAMLQYRLLKRLCIRLVIHFFLKDRTENPENFPAGFVKGVAEGFWWSFISMTTVG